ncbi:putative molybdenum carrier [compost metagenome]
MNLKEHKSSSYAPRTYHNAAQGITLAIAVDFKTAGEKLTHKAAGGKIVQIDYFNTLDKLYPSRALYSMLKKHDCRVVNVAGNGIYTLQKKGVSQEDINAYVYNILKLVNEHWKIDKVVSGGQTGADIAGLVAAYKLGIPLEGTWPKGYKMRFEDGEDVEMHPDNIKQMIIDYAELLNE